MHLGEGIILRVLKIFTSSFIVVTLIFIIIGCSGNLNDSVSDIDTYELSLSIDGQGSVKKEPDKNTFEENTEVDLTANPAEYWYFNKWEGSGFTGVKDKNITVTMDSDLNLIADFSSRNFVYNNSDSEVRTSRIDGSNDKLVNEDNSDYWNVTWGPEDSKIIYCAGLPADIYKINPDGSGKSLLIENSNDVLNFPDCTSSGNKIAYINTSQDKIVVIDINGNTISTPVDFGSGPDNWSGLSWSPDGDKLIISSTWQDLDGPDKDLYILSSDGNGNWEAWEDAQLLTNNSAEDEYPAWSPNGDKIAYVKNADIYTINSTGDNPNNLTNSSSLENHPTWSPDSDEIAFISDKDGDNQIFIMKANGSDNKEDWFKVTTDKKVQEINWSNK